ncbi:MAG: response regulator [Sulfuricella sp.]|nr:response regulator [Sulfuricella sp.]
MTLSKILYVEDEPDLQTLTRLALEMVGGFTVKVCGSGAEALEQAPAFAPDLLLLDVVMPEMDGPATLQRLRAIPGLAATPAIFMTGVQPDEIGHFTALGAIGVIAKPFDPVTLADTIRNLWAQYHD